MLFMDNNKLKILIIHKLIREYLNLENLDFHKNNEFNYEEKMKKNEENEEK